MGIQFDTRIENNDTLYYHFLSDVSCICSMRCGSVWYSTTSGGRLLAKYTSYHTERGYCYQRQGSISYSGMVTYNATCYVSR